MKKEFATLEELNAFAEKLFNEQKYVIQASQLPNQTFLLQWIEHKTYTTHDGKEHLDEVWTNIQGEIMLVQDMSEAHVRNCLRLLLRNEREMLDAARQLAKEAAEQLKLEDTMDEKPYTLH